MAAYDKDYPFWLYKVNNYVTARTGVEHSQWRPPPPWLVGC